MCVCVCCMCVCVCVSVCTCPHVRRRLTRSHQQQQQQPPRQRPGLQAFQPSTFPPPPPQPPHAAVVAGPSRTPPRPFLHPPACPSLMSCKMTVAAKTRSCASGRVVQGVRGPLSHARPVLAVHEATAAVAVAEHSLQACHPGARPHVSTCPLVHLPCESAPSQDI